nr:retrovirus-related Pol polyprotein from transposon TNT 1-94 [Tanacetum cinerariifolium]
MCQSLRLKLPPLSLELDANHGGCKDDCKSTSGDLQYLGEMLVRWSSKKQDCTAMSIAKAEYVSLPEYQLGDLFTKALPKERFEYLVYRIVPFPLLEKLAGVKLIPGTKTIKSNLKLNPTFKAKTLKGITLKEPSSTPAKDNKKDVSYDPDTHGYNRVISLRRGIKPRNPKHVTKNYKTCGSNVCTTSNHNDIEWFKKKEALQSKKAESFKFATIIENASGATSKNISSAGQSTTSHAEEEKNITKDAETNLKNELVDLLGIDVISLIRDHILNGDIELHFIPTQYQLADIFTKPLDELTFKRLIVELGVDTQTLESSKVFVVYQNLVRKKFGLLGLSRVTGSSLGVISSDGGLCDDDSAILSGEGFEVVGEMHKKAQQSVGGLTSLGATCKEGAHPHLSSEDQQATGDPNSLWVTNKERANPQLSSDFTAEADPGLSGPNDSIPPQQGMDEGTKNTLYDHISASTDPYVLADQTKSVSEGLETGGSGVIDDVYDDGKPCCMLETFDNNARGSAIDPSRSILTLSQMSFALV